MLSSLHLRLVDHVVLVEQGVSLVNQAIEANDPSVLIEYLASLPFTPNPKMVAYRQDRIRRLTELHAPEVILRNEEYLLNYATGAAFSREILTDMSLEDIRERFGLWEREGNVFDLNSAWRAIEWYLQPGEVTNDLLMSATRPELGDPAQTAFDRALRGSQPGPLDCTGLPVIRSIMPEVEGESFGYNPPDSIATIYEALAAVDPDAWDAWASRRAAEYERSTQPWTNIPELVERELENAKAAFPVAQAAYKQALETNRGVSCEFLV